MQNDTLSIHPSFRLSISSKNLIAVNSDVDTDVCTSICLSLWVHPSPSPPRPPLLPMPLHLIMLGISKKLFLFFFVFLVSHLCLSQRMDETDETNYFFLMLALLRRISFLTTFYGLYFSHHCTHITSYNLSLKMREENCNGDYSIKAQFKVTFFKWFNGFYLVLSCLNQ